MLALPLAAAISRSSPFFFTIPMMVLMYALAENRTTLREPDIARKTVYGLACVEFAFMLVVFLGLVGPALTGHPLKFILSVSVLALVGTGVCLAVWGLSEIHAARPRVLKGSAQAAGALVGAGVLLAILFWNSPR